jgi:hypothetical protein
MPEEIPALRQRPLGFGHIPKERRELSTWQHVEATLLACAAGDDAVNISVALRIVLQAERVP